MLKLTWLYLAISRVSLPRTDTLKPRLPDLRLAHGQTWGTDLILSGPLRGIAGALPCFGNSWACGWQSRPSDNTQRTSTSPAAQFPCVNDENTQSGLIVKDQHGDRPSRSPELLYKTPSTKNCNTKNSVKTQKKFIRNLCPAATMFNESRSLESLTAPLHIYIISEAQDTYAC